MRKSRISATWLSDEMAHALAAMWPPLDTADVMQAADKLTSHPGVPPDVHLLRREDVGHQEIEPGMIEALRALHDLGA
ncbi:MAG: hypothetical protein M3069_18195 [Chloroflexota bacterium]|nr:hypothetical protein [Chloroflexota bacterium]